MNCGENICLNNQYDKFDSSLSTIACVGCLGWLESRESREYYSYAVYQMPWEMTDNAHTHSVFHSRCYLPFLLVGYDN